MSTMPSKPTDLVPNHHADHPGFSGIKGWLAALSMRAGRTGHADLAIEFTGMGAGDRVVDIGCGPGVAARLAADGGATVTGVDPADVMLRTARRSDRRSAVTWKTGMAEALPLPDDSHDIAWSLASVHHWPELEAGIAEAHRVLAPGGRFLAMERLTRPGATGLASHGWTEAQAERFGRMCEAAGFESIEVSTRSAGRGRVVAVLATKP